MSQQETSPSGRYTLDISSASTKPGCWDHTTGVITRASDSSVVATVNRNYCSFPFLWVEDHVNSHSYLVCGEDYQGQTVIELDTGTRRDFLPEEAKKGCGFCWAETTYEPRLNMLVVEGCYWACPYEFKFYDFSDPMKQGWMEIKADKEYFDASNKRPLINALDGTITCYETSYPSDDDDTEEKPHEIVATKTLKREGLVLHVIDRWIDPKEQARRDVSEAARKAWDDAWKEYKKTDPLYLLVMERVVSDGLDNAEYSTSVGQVYEGWCPHFSDKDGRVCKRLVEKRVAKEGGTSITVDLEWGRTVAPIKVLYYQNGKEADVQWFEHSLEGMTLALDFVKSVV